MGIIDKFTNYLLGISKSYKREIKIFSNCLSLTIPAGLIIWAIGIKLPGPIDLEPEAVVAILAFFDILIKQFYKRLYELSEYSPAEVLALGYVKNFLVPAIAQVRAESGKEPKIYIFKPKEFSDLDQDYFESVKSKLKVKRLKLEEVVLTNLGSKTRRLYTIYKTKGKQIYFDLPSTLSSLADYIDYKISTKEDATIAEKPEMTKKLFKQFYKKVRFYSRIHGISSSVQFCNRKLDFPL